MNKIPCPAPPMGWNSFDAFGSSVTEDQFKANVDYMEKHLKPLGWEYAVVDFCWSHPDPGPVENPNLTYNDKGFGEPELAMDDFGRLLPHPDRFPSAADNRGFAPLADYVHSKGMKFGIHIMRGIPRNAVSGKTPIKNTDRHAGDIARKGYTCRWLNHNVGLDMSKAGAQEYYDSLLELYASWGVDFIKADDMSYLHPHPGLPLEDGLYAREEIEALRKAAEKCGRDIIISLSCGPTPVSEADHVKNNAHMWRITQDFWDNWDALKELFYFAREWEDHREEGSWPDADMIPFGRLSLCGPKGPPRYSGFSDSEKRVLMTLLTMFRSPLMVGGNLPEIDDYSLSLLTNEEAIRLNQRGTGSREIYNDGTLLIWKSRMAETDYVAFFNLGDFPRRITPEDTVGVSLARTEDQAREVWTGHSYAVNETTAVPPHSALLLAFEKGE